MTVARLDDYRPRLGGSTIAAAAGVDPYCSPIRLWLELTGRIERAETEPMRLGRRLEPVIFDELTERGYPVTRTPGVELYDDMMPWLVGHPDGFGVGALDGSVIEAKATGRPTETLPIAHEAQVQTYMQLAGIDSAVVAQLGGLTFQVWQVERHPHLIDTLLALGEAFVDHVRRDSPPAPQGHPDDRHALLALYPGGAGGKVRETREVRDARHELVALLEAEKRRTARIELLRARITDHMGDGDTLVSAHDETVATWKQVTSRRIDTRKLKAERPDIHEAYSTPTTTRRFLLT